MAARRMFAKSVVQSARFLQMPVSSRLLYYDLGMAADDDGVVEAFTVMRMTAASTDDLRILVSKSFIEILNDELVVLIKDWATNNQIRSDRYHESIYKDLIKRSATTCLPFGTNSDTRGLPSDTNLDTSGLPHNNQQETDCLPKDGHHGTQLEPQSSLGKDSLDEGSQSQVKLDKEKLGKERGAGGNHWEEPRPSRAAPMLRVNAVVTSEEPPKSKDGLVFGSDEYIRIFNEESDRFALPGENPRYFADLTGPMLVNLERCEQSRLQSGRPKERSSLVRDELIAHGFW